VTNNNRIDGLLRRGNHFYDVGNYKNASLTFDSLIKLDSTKGEVFYKKGFSNSKINRLIESMDSFEKAIEHGYRTADSYYNMGLNQILLDNDSITFDNDPNSPKAIIYFEKCLKSSPSPQTENDAVSMIKAFKKKKQIEL
jgi:tetratricopeptide (TPR) repeat protein